MILVCIIDTSQVLPLANVKHVDLQIFPKAAFICNIYKQSMYLLKTHSLMLCICVLFA